MREKSACRSGALAALLILLVMTATPRSGSAQSDEPLWDELHSLIKSEPFSVGALFQFVGDFQSNRSFPGEDGFSVANFRLSIGGRLDGGFDYFLQSNFGDLLDARIGFQLSESATIDVGRFKAPYSREFLTAAAGIDFVNRSQSVTALGPGRALGLAVRGRPLPSWSYGIGVFNAGGNVAGNAAGRFRAVGRVAWNRELGEGAAVEVAVNGAYNGDRTPIELDADPALANLKGLFGVDTRVTIDEWLVAAELDLGIDPLVGGSSPWGGFLTVGRMVSDKSQLLARLDHFDTGLLDDRRMLLVFGWNLWPTNATELQVNVIAPVDGFSGEPQLLTNLQIAF